MLHEGPNGKPEAVHQRELVLYNVGLLVTRMRVEPFVWAEPGHGVKDQRQKQRMIKQTKQINENKRIPTSRDE